MPTGRTGTGITDTRVRAVLAEHAHAVRALDAFTGELPPCDDELPRADGRWSTLEELLHVVITYEAGLAALRGELRMQPRVSRARARVLRERPLAAVRLLSAHTRHHVRRPRARIRAVDARGS